ncbi:helix-turn-helix domain-containing protein [Brevundimonas sp.]|uniref:helix-turn-helix domain-containing protein n=1 Tax=Brevundimonas sp. TaxID=1871086 RepID=UPI0035B2C1BF
MTFTADEHDFDPLRDCPSLGEALRAARQSSGRSLEQLSATTKVHVRYLTALEYGDYGLLPSRVFALGYLRAYAQALGLDEHAAAQRFRREAPDDGAKLRGPVGVAHDEIRTRAPLVIGGVAVLLVAVIGWNIFQRVVRIAPPHPSEIAVAPKEWAETPGLDQTGLTLGAPTPAPEEQTVPQLYVTPGLEAQLLGIDPEDAEALAAVAAANAPPVQAAFNPRGPVHGAGAAESDVILQADRASVLVIRIGDRVLFARQMAEGESWRAPRGLAATIDAADPQAFSIYLNGEHAGRLAAAETPLQRLNAQAASAQQQAAAVQAARAEALRAEALKLEAQRALAARQAAEASPPAAPAPG